MAARPRGTPSPKQIKDALRQASDDDLFYEACRRGVISTLEIERRERWREAIKSKEYQEDSAARHREYVEQLFALLHQKWSEKMEEKCRWRTHISTEFTALGAMMTKIIFDHLVDARRAALDKGNCNIESLLEDFMSNRGHSFAESLVSGDVCIPPYLWASLIRSTIHCVAMSLLDIVDEDASEAPDQDRDKEPGFIN